MSNPEFSLDMPLKERRKNKTVSHSSPNSDNKVAKVGLTFKGFSMFEIIAYFPLFNRFSALDKLFSQPLISLFQ
jgi:hypothetical protein